MQERDIQNNVSIRCKIKWPIRSVEDLVCTMYGVLFYYDSTEERTVFTTMLTQFSSDKMN